MKSKIIFLVIALLCILLVSCDTQQPNHEIPNPSTPGEATSDKSDGSHTHDYEGSWKTFKEPTCTESGLKTGTCACGNETVVELPATGHTEAVLSGKAPTCTEPGLYEGKKCSTCNTVLVEQQEIPATGHAEIVLPATAPTCVSTGLSEGKKCSVCSAVLVSQTTLEALGHAYTEEVLQEATCKQDGSSRMTCANCGDTQTQTIAFPEYSANEIFEMYKSAVGEVLTYDKAGNEYALGTCFAFSQDGKVITNYHVIEEAYSAEITINGETYPVRQVLAYDKVLDLAVLKIDATDLLALPICKNEHAVGDSVFAFGSSKGLTATFSQGIITYTSREVDGILYVQHDAAISSGNSGGPLINNHGEVIGVNTWTVRDSQNLNFAIMMSEMDNLTFGKPLTMAELYELECDVFTKLKNYVINKGTYDASDREYTLTLGTSYANDYSSKYTRQISYRMDDDELVLYLFINAENMVSITIDEVDGVYEWWYYDDDDYYMYGDLYAASYDSDTLLGYNGNNIYYSTLRTTIRKLASAMVSLLCAYMDQDFSSIGVTAEDLGFLQY